MREEREGWREMYMCITSIQRINVTLLPMHEHKTHVMIHSHSVPFGNYMYMYVHVHVQCTCFHCVQNT